MYIIIIHHRWGAARNDSGAQPNPGPRGPRPVQCHPPEHGAAATAAAAACRRRQAGRQADRKTARGGERCPRGRMLPRIKPGTIWCVCCYFGYYTLGERRGVTEKLGHVV
eukprot:COSAG06_NODE_25666_length_631_cov_1.163534_1_plen_109_part_01